MVLSGPSGVGKDSVLRELKSLDHKWRFTVTVTTRSQRPGEEDGVDYFFLDRDTFHHRVESGGFLECAQVYGNWYGVPRDQVSDALENGMDVVIKADVQGAATIKATVPDAILIFLMPHPQRSWSAGCESEKRRPPLTWSCAYAPLWTSCISCPLRLRGCQRCPGVCGKPHKRHSHGGEVPHTIPSRVPVGRLRPARPQNPLPV